MRRIHIAIKIMEKAKLMAEHYDNEDERDEYLSGILTAIHWILIAGINEFNEFFREHVNPFDLASNRNHEP